MNQPQPASPQNPPQSFYDAVGGEETFRLIVHRFYQQVPDDDILGPMYPHDDMEGAEHRLRWFLEQYWGGPTTFSQLRGHPRLRMRHNHFAITEEGADRWLSLMKRAIDTIDNETLDPPHRAAMWDHMQRVAQMLINTETA